MKPWATNERKDAGRILPKATQPRQEHLLQLVDRLEETIDKTFSIFDHIPELFTGIQFRAIRRQRYNQDLRKSHGNGGKFELLRKEIIEHALFDSVESSGSLSGNMS